METGNRRFVLGNLPPPLGGVSTFMHRHVAARIAAGERLTVLDWVKTPLIGRIAWIARLLFDPRRLHVELNAYETWSMAALVIRPFPARVLLRMHSGRPESNLRGARRRIFAAALARADDLVLVGGHVRDVLEAAGFRVPDRFRIQPAFLPPPPEDEPAVRASWPASCTAFAGSHRPLMVMQGADGFQDGLDLYGTDLAVEALEQLRDRWPDIGLVIGRPNRGDEAFRQHCAMLDRRIRERDLPAYVLDGERQIWPLVRDADLFLRPTTSDGDSIGVREALHFGVPVVASDAAPRPDGVHVFASRNVEAFVRAIDHVLTERNATHDPGDATTC